MAKGLASRLAEEYNVSYETIQRLLGALEINLDPDDTVIGADETLLASLRGRLEEALRLERTQTGGETGPPSTAPITHSAPQKPASLDPIAATAPYSRSRRNEVTPAYGAGSMPTAGYDHSGDAPPTAGYNDERIPDTPAGTLPHDLSVGQSIQLKNRTYRVTKIISQAGQTGEAAVYRVTDRSGALLALKLYKPFEKKREEPNREALARLSTQVRDDAILQLVDYGVGSDKHQGVCCWEIMTFATGGDLLSVPDIHAKYTPAFVEKAVVPQIFRGLTTLHQNGIIHCDLKPRNVFYYDEKQTELVIGDYGSAKTPRADSTGTYSITSLVKTTSDYAPFEQMKNIIGSPCDYYAFGMILVHLLYPEVFSDRQVYDRLLMRQFNRKQPLDFNPAFGRLNTLIAGLTLADFENRWGEEEVRTWIEHPETTLEVRYETGTNVWRIDAETKIASFDDLAEYVRTHRDWYSVLFETSKSAFDRWLEQEVKGSEAARPFYDMVAHFAQYNIPCTRDAIVFSLKPDSALVLGREVKRTYKLLDTDEPLEVVRTYLEQLDDIWTVERNTEQFDFATIQRELLRLEIALCAAISNTNGKQHKQLQGVYDRIQSGLGLSDEGTLPFKPFATMPTCLYDSFAQASEAQLLDLLYSLRNDRGFRAERSTSLATLQDIGLYFAANQQRFKQRPMRLELEAFVRHDERISRKEAKILTDAGLHRFLFRVFRGKALTEMAFVNISLNDKHVYTLEYRLYRSLSGFFRSKGIAAEIDEKVSKAQSKATRTYTFKRPFFSSARRSFEGMLTDLHDDIDTNNIPGPNRDAFYREFAAAYRHIERRHGGVETAMALAPAFMGILLATIGYLILTAPFVHIGFLEASVRPKVILLLQQVGDYVRNPEINRFFSPFQVVFLPLALLQGLSLFGFACARRCGVQREQESPSEERLVVVALGLFLWMLPNLFHVANELWEALSLVGIVLLLGGPFGLLAKVSGDWKESSSPILTLKAALYLCLLYCGLRGLILVITFFSDAQAMFEKPGDAYSVLYHSGRGIFDIALYSLTAALLLFTTVRRFASSRLDYRRILAIALVFDLVIVGAVLGYASGQNGNPTVSGVGSEGGNMGTHEEQDASDSHLKTIRAVHLYSSNSFGEGWTNFELVPNEKFYLLAKGHTLKIIDKGRSFEFAFIDGRKVSAAVVNNPDQTVIMDKPFRITGTNRPVKIKVRE